MSEILDALKKLEREKAIRSNTAPNIAVEILTPDLPGRGKRNSFYIVTLSLSALAAAGITYALILGWGGLSRSSPPVALNTPPSPSKQTARVAAESRAAPSSTPLSTKAPLSVDAAKPRSKPRATPAPPSAPAPRVEVHPKAPAPMRPAPSEPDQAAPVPAQSAAPVKSAPIVPAAPSPPVSPAARDLQDDTPRVPSPVVKERNLNTIGVGEVPPPPPGGSAATPPVLKITVIVWDEDPSKRWAMINGLKLSEGSMIEGAKLEEINLTSVRFLHNGRHFEISTD